MARKVQAKQSKKADDSKLFAFLAVLLSIIGFVIAYAVKKDDKYVMFYAKQSLVLFFAWLVIWVASLILGMIPFIGMVIIAIAEVCLVVIWIFGLVYSLSGEMKEVPLLGQFARKFSF